MVKVRIVNKCKDLVRLELATHDPGKGMEHKALKPKEELVVEDTQLTDQIRGLTKTRRGRKVPPILLEDLKEKLEDPAPSTESADDVEPCSLVCEVCGKEYKSEFYFNQHMEDHEEELMNDSSDDSDSDGE